LVPGSRLWRPVFESWRREGNFTARSRCKKVKRERFGDESRRLGIRENPCRVNLRRGSGMKQAHKVYREEKTVESVRNTEGGT
jgi:hypothetical protein